MGLSFVDWRRLEIIFCSLVVKEHKPLLTWHCSMNINRFHFWLIWLPYGSPSRSEISLDICSLRRFRSSYWSKIKLGNKAGLHIRTVAWLGQGTSIFFKSWNVLKIDFAALIGHLRSFLAFFGNYRNIILWLELVRSLLYLLLRQRLYFSENWVVGNNNLILEVKHISSRRIWLRVAVHRYFIENPIVNLFIRAFNLWLCDVWVKNRFIQSLIMLLSSFVLRQPVPLGMIPLISVVISILWWCSLFVT